MQISVANNLFDLEDGRMSLRFIFFGGTGLEINIWQIKKDAHK